MLWLLSIKFCFAYFVTYTVPIHFGSLYPDLLCILSILLKYLNSCFTIFSNFFSYNPTETSLLYFVKQTKINSSHLVKVSQVSNFVPQLCHDFRVFLVLSLIPGSLAFNDGISYGQAFKVIFVKAVKIKIVFN